MFDVSFDILDNLHDKMSRYTKLTVVEDEGRETVKSFETSYEATKEAFICVANLAEDFERVRDCVNGKECVLNCSEEEEPNECPFMHSFPVIITVILDCYKMRWIVNE